MPSKLTYTPLGGLGEVGLNMWALEWQGEVLVVDAGLMFPQEDMLGIDLVIPDISHLLEAGRRVHGIFLTHGHEDHVGALPFILKRLNVPVFGTRLTLGLLQNKLREHKILREADLREVRDGDRVQIGPFRVETIPTSHSIPDSVALAIETPVGRVVYTSDFKIDPDPPDGRATDVARLAALGREGVLLLLSDSTNAERQGHSGSERELIEPFEEIFRTAPGRVVIATFASNIHRIQQVVSLAEEHGRRLGVVGRSLQNNFRTAQELGYLRVPQGLVVPFEEEALTDSRLVLVTAGVQGEPMSALSRFAAQRHPVVNVRKDDWVVISARPIPGNERMVNQTVNNLYRNGARVFYAEVGHVHVSGHAQREELETMLRLTAPRFFIPVHGEYRQLHHHAEIARGMGIPDANILIVEDGRTVRLTADSMEPGDTVSAGFVFVDGLGIGDVEQVVLRDRRRLSQDGIVIVTLTLDRTSGRLRAGPELISRGFIEPDLSASVMDELRRAIIGELERLAGGPPELNLVKETVHDLVQRHLNRRTKRRPMVIPLVTEL